MYTTPSEPGSIVTSTTSMRGSQRSSDARTSYATWPANVASTDENTRSWTPQPNSGRIGRSPWAVPRISRMLSEISSSPPDSAMPPVAETPSGYDQPLPMKSTAAISPSDQGGRGAHQGRPGHAAGGARIPGARRRLAAEQHRRAALDHDAGLRRRHHERVRRVQPHVR